MTEAKDKTEPQLRPAVFLDRDGVMNLDKGYVHRIADFEWVEGARELIQHFKEMGFLVIVVTNQSGIARGFYRVDAMEELHHWINQELGSINAQIDGFYYCPHHPEGSMEEYRKDCDCRKPEPGMILQALQEWPIDKRDSFLIGDSERDIVAANSAGIQGYLFEGGNLYEWAKQINLIG